MPSPDWHCRAHRFRFPGRALVVGILNVTPDSFSDSGTAFDPATAVERGLAMIADGADLIDIGGESTRPGSRPVPAAEQLRRIAPVVAALARQSAVPLSIDTTRAEVAAECLLLGASVVNDISGLRDDPAMPGLVAETGAGVIVMHMQGTPAIMQDDPTYADVVAEVDAFFAECLGELGAAGVRPEQIALDPGIGFGKTPAHNLTLLADLAHFQRHGRPVCLGVSRKGFLGHVTGRPLQERGAGSLAVAALALGQGAVQLLRVHDVAMTRDAVLLDEAIDAHRHR